MEIEGQMGEGSSDENGWCMLNGLISLVKEPGASKLPLLVDSSFPKLAGLVDLNFQIQTGQVD